MTLYACAAESDEKAMKSMYEPEVAPVSKVRTTPVAPADFSADVGSCVFVEPTFSPLGTLLMGEARIEESEPGAGDESPPGPRIEPPESSSPQAARARE